MAGTDTETRDERPAPPTSEPASRARVALAPLAWSAALALAVWLAWLAGRDLTTLHLGAPPFVGKWDPTLDASVALPVLVALAVVWMGRTVAARLSWGALLAASVAATGAWAVALALVDGADRLTVSLASRWEHLAVLPIGSPARFLDSFVERVPELPTHVKSHPPGTVLFYSLLERIGLGGAGWATAVVILVGASSTAAVLVAVRQVGDEATARRVAPFLVLAPSAVWLATASDALYVGVASWAVALLVLATGSAGRRGVGLALAGGLLAGVTLMLSYGLVLLATVPAAVIAFRRRWSVAAIAGVAALAVPGLAAASGFWWLDGLAATRVEYWAGVASERPFAWFVVGNLLVTAVAVGPAGIAAIGRLPAALRSSRGRGVALLGVAALAAVVLADLSGLSKGEVERIWLPFFPWILTATAFLPRPPTRWWLAASAATAIVVQVLLRSPW